MAFDQGWQATPEADRHASLAKWYHDLKASMHSTFVSILAKPVADRIPLRRRAACVADMPKLALQNEHDVEA